VEQGDLLLVPQVHIESGRRFESCNGKKQGWPFDGLESLGRVPGIVGEVSPL